MIKNFTFVRASGVLPTAHCAAFIIEKNSALISLRPHRAENGIKTQKRSQKRLAAGE